MLKIKSSLHVAGINSKKEAFVMYVKEYLSQALRLDQRINSKLEQMAMLRSMTTKVTASLHSEPVSPTKERSPMENALVKLIDLEHEINLDIDKLVDLKREMTRFIAGIENPSFKLLLELRYLTGNTWEDVAGVMGCKLRWIYRLHDDALREASKYLFLLGH